MASCYEKRFGDERFQLRQLLALLVFLLGLHAAAIAVFTHGFLLTRVELPHRSSCAVDADAGSRAGRVNAADGENAAVQHCSRPAFDKVVLLIIDALRYDFAVSESNDTRAWLGRMPIFEQLMQHSSATAMFKFIADPPTTTMQRLKGLTTGGLPTFIDVGSSFGAPAITEDNIIQQLRSNNKLITMMGDETWMDLFPQQFTTASPFPSLNVKDLHTVDDGVEAALFPALQRAQDWDLLIAHFLGVDHVGHTFGVDAVPMTAKLEQMNRDVVSLLRGHGHALGMHENTLLVVMGDHGQTLHGDHGGGAPEEVESILFAYSPGADHARVRRPLPTWLRSPPCNTEQGVVGAQCVPDLPQLDFAATLATLMGVPIPFGSVGHASPELWALSPRVWLPAAAADEGALLHWLQGLNRVLLENSLQVHRYMAAYSSAALSPLPHAEMAHCTTLLQSAQALPIATPGQSTTQNLHLEQARCLKSLEYLSAVASLARDQWTQFDSVTIACGTGLFAIALFVFSIAMVWSRHLSNVPWMRVLAVAVVAGCSAIAVCTRLQVQMFEGGKDMSNVIRVAQEAWPLGLTAAVAASAIAFLAAVINRTPIETATTPDEGRQATVFGWLSALFAIMHAVSLTSNSFMVAEGKVAQFLLASAAVMAIRHANSRQQLLHTIIILATGAMMGVCGQEYFNKDAPAAHQVAGGATHVNVSPYLQLSSPTLVTETVVRHACLLLLPTLMTRYQVAQRTGKGVFPVLQTVLWGSYALVTVFWLDTIMPFNSSGNTLLLWPRLIYALTLIGSLAVMALSLTQQTAATAQKATCELVGAVLFIVSAPLVLLSGRHGAFVALLALLHANSYIQLQKLSSQSATGVTGSESGSKAAAGTWSLGSTQLFFCTGHRCTFDALHFTAAFVGFREFHFWRGAVLLSANTFSAQIVFTLALPLLATAPGGSTLLSRQLRNTVLSFLTVRTLDTAVIAACAYVGRSSMCWDDLL
eukprot:jgi/Chlat1/6672/Chrsp49S06156